MSKFEKALVRLRNRPKDFSWKELQTIMNHFGYVEIKGSATCRKFINKTTKVSMSLQEPHPAPQMKRYAIDIIVEHLGEEELL